MPLLVNKAFSKTLSTTFFLYFSIILPAIAFGNLQNDNTEGKINVEKVRQDPRLQGRVPGFRRGGVTG